MRSSAKPTTTRESARRCLHSPSPWECSRRPGGRAPIRTGSLPPRPDRRRRWAARAGARPARRCIGRRRRAILEQAAELLIPLGNYRDVASAYSSAAYVALTEDRSRKQPASWITALQRSGRIEDPWRRRSSSPTSVSPACSPATSIRPATPLSGRCGCPPRTHCARSPTRSLAGLAAVAAATRPRRDGGETARRRPRLGYPPATFDKRIDDRLERDYLAAARARYGRRPGGPMSRPARSCPGQAIAYALGERSERPTGSRPARRSVTADERLDGRVEQPAAGRGARAPSACLRR